MKLKTLLLFILLQQSVAVMSQNTQSNTSNNNLLEDNDGHLIQSKAEQIDFLKIREELRKKENQFLKSAKLSSKTTATQKAVEICTNGGFEQLETISGSSYIKNFLYTIGDPAGPTQCRSISNTADTPINSYNPNDSNLMATGVSSNHIDYYAGNINAFDQYALKINHQSSSTYGSIVQGKRFKTNNENYLKFNYKAVLQSVYDNSHADNQAFVKARIINKNGVVVNEFCLVGDEKNCIFTRVPSQSSSYVTLYTANWQSGFLDISSIPNNEEFTVEFMASRCGLGGHFGYMYIDDICLLHSEENFQGSVELEPLNKVCPTLPVAVCGTYTIPNSGGIAATVKKITLSVYDSTNAVVYSTSTTSSLDPINKKFCFSLDTAAFPNSTSANYNVGVKVDYEIAGNSCGGTTVNSASDTDANPGWDISFLNCDASCTINLTTAKITQCDSNRDGTENFDLSKFSTLIVTTSTGLNFSYYSNYNDAQANINAIANFTNYPSSSTSIYVRVSKNGSCYKIIAVGLEVRNPTANIKGILNVCSGSTKLTASSGNSYLWNNGETPQTITVTATGNYSVVVTDSFGCSSEATVTIEPSQTAPLPVLEITQPSCFSITGSIKVVSPASEYSFDDGATWGTNDTKANLSPGTYLVMIRTVNGCTSYSQKVLISGASNLFPNYSYTNPQYCGDVGSITITNSSAFFSIDDGATWVTYSTFNNLTYGNYKIRIKDAQGCISAANNVLISSNSLGNPTYEVTPPACGELGNIIITTVSDFYTFDGGVTWVTNNQSNNLKAGNYSIGIKNALGCTSYFSYVYLNDYEYLYPNYTLEQPICGSDGNITITTVSDFYSFDNGVTWTTNNTANLPEGTYRIKTKNSAGCISASNYISLYKPYLNSPMISSVQPTCGTDGKITINTLSDFYSFDNGITWTTLNSKSLAAGYYTIIVKNSLGCISYPTTISLYNPKIAAPTYTVTQPTCTSTGSVTINTIADFYSFDGGNTWGSISSISNLTSYKYYSIAVKNNLGCISDYVGVAISAANFPDPDYTVTNPSCGKIGNITFNSTADFYSIDYGKTWGTNPIFDNLSSGNYYLLVKKLNCESKIASVYLSTDSLAPPKYTLVQPSCGTKGSLTITTPAAFYSINGQVWTASPIFTDLSDGYYYPQIKNAQGCTSSYSGVRLDQFYLPLPTYTTTQATCGNGGSITITTSAAEYSIDAGITWSTNPTFNNLKAGYYRIAIKNSTGCTSNPYNLTTFIDVYYLPNPDFTIVQPTCGTNGSITIATVASSYSFDNGTTWSTNPKLSGITSGYYNIIIKNALGCISAVIPLQINTFYLTSPKVTVVQPSCGNGGSITINTAADNYSFDGGKTWTTNPVLLNPAATIYTVLIKNVLGCQSRSQTYLIDKFYLPTPNTAVIQPTCSDPLGTITVSSLADQYSFDNGLTWTTNPVKKNAAVGYHNILIKNNLGCVSNSRSIYVYNPPYIPAAPVVTVVQPSSCAATDGSITITTKGINYSFNNGNSWTTNPKKINIGEGTYIIKIQIDSYSCESATTIVNLSSGTTIAAPTFTEVQPNCNTSKGAITITTNAATYSYDNGLTYVYSNTKTDLSPGIYFVKIKSASGCISEGAKVTISLPTALPAPIYKVVQPDCSAFTGSIVIETIADEYSFDDGLTFGTSNTRTNLSSGTYNLKIKYNSACISLSAPVTIKTAPTIPLAPQVIVKDPSGCDAATGTIVISTAAELYSFDDGVTWGSNNTASLLPGNYAIRIKSINGCASNPYNVNINEPPNAPQPPTLNTNQPVSCSNPFGTISISSTAAKYSFDNGVTYSTNPFSGNLAPGTYLVRVKNSSDCASAAVLIKIEAPTDYPKNPDFTSTQPDCNNLKGAITITDIASSYSFDNGITWTTNPTKTNLAPGDYLIKVKSSIGCISSSSSAKIIPFTNFTPHPIATARQSFCIQQNAIINNIIITGQNIKWYDAVTAGTVLTNDTPLQNGITYYASQTINGCESERAPVTIQIQNTAAPTGNGRQTFCSSQNPTLSTITVTGSTIKWYDAAASGTLLSNTTLLQNGSTYYATQTENGCESVNRLAVQAVLITTLPAKNYDEMLCDDLNDSKEIVNLTSYNTNLIATTSGYSFSYYSTLAGAENELANSKIVNPTTYKILLGTTTIYVRINSPTACYAIAFLKLTVVAKPIITIADTVPICANTSITITAGAGYDSYLWSTGETTPSIVVTNPAHLSVTVTKNYGTINCSSTKDFVVKKSTVATITSIETKDWTDNSNMITVYTTGTGDFEYTIDGDNYQNSNQFTNLLSGAYTVQVRDKNGCGTTTNTVFLLMYPKFFTPNGDNFNDTWSIRFSENEPQLSVKIFDRYGKLITSLKQNESWNGTYNGQLLPSTDYWFVVTRADGKEYKGHFSMKR